MAQIKTYKYADTCPTRDDIKVYVNGEEQFIYYSDNSDILTFSFEGEANVEVVYNHEVKNSALRPYSKNYKCNIEGNKVTFTLDKPISLLLDTEGERQLHVHANPISETPEDCTYVFRAGKVYDEGEFVLKDGESMYIEGGAVVRGTLNAKDADNIHIYGYGIFDGNLFKDTRRMWFFDNCKNLTIEDVILVNPRLWTLTLLECSDVNISRLKESCTVISSDGIDIVASHNVTIKGCFLRNNDDCVVVKSMVWGDSKPKPSDVYNVRVSDCTLINESSGNAMEIGHELRSDRVYDIRFDNIDVISVHGFGAAFSIHNADCAVIEDVHYSNIRVEHYYDKLVDFRIIKSMWGKSEERGFIKDVHFENIQVTNSIYNPGYSNSLMGGYDKDHVIKNVTFKDFYVGGKKVTQFDEMPMYLLHAEDIKFE